jgi:GNAT superfamily N-acetyltransferase
VAQSAFVVRVPEAEPWVGALRQRFDPSAKQGVPAHITVLYPFMAPELVSEQVLADVRRALRGMSAFGFHLGRVGRFPATTYLAPEPAAPFIALTRRLAAQFPAYPPYGGEHEGVVPHLTAAHGDAEGASIAEAELAAALASGARIESFCSELTLLENATGVWREMHTFPLQPCMQEQTRTGREQDAEAIAALLPHLGYDASVEQVRQRLAALLASPSHAVFLCERDGRVAGLCLIASVKHLASDGYAEVLELVVRAEFQRQGIGRRLVERAQAWASQQGHRRVRLRSGVHRAEAHAFYERLGYTKSRASYAFELVLASS